jgi:glycosyltransferase involved in cell wall biosynthesis
VAREAGRKLIIAGLIQDELYFEEKVRPHIDGDMVRYVGMVSAENKAEVLGHAYALLHLIGFDEPFGFSVVEAMACGTPVVAYAKGSMSEIIDEGRTGFLVDDVAGAVAAVGRIASLDRPTIRELTVSRFHRMTMARHYSDLYQRLISTGG